MDRLDLDDNPMKRREKGCINHSTELKVGDVALHPQRTFGNTKMVLVVTPGELLLASGEWRPAVLVHTLQDRTELPIR